LVASLTWEQSSAMAEHAAFRLADHIDVHCAVRQSPIGAWQERRSNGLLGKCSAETITVTYDQTHISLALADTTTRHVECALAESQQEASASSSCAQRLPLDDTSNTRIVRISGTP
jgi:hypothetical protein